MNASPFALPRTLL